MRIENKQIYDEGMEILCGEDISHVDELILSHLLIIQIKIESAAMECSTFPRRIG
jgi:hypothetical protein